MLGIKWHACTDAVPPLIKGGPSTELQGSVYILRSSTAVKPHWGWVLVEYALSYTAPDRLHNTSHVLAALSSHALQEVHTSCVSAQCFSLHAVMQLHRRQSMMKQQANGRSMMTPPSMTGSLLKEILMKR